MRRKLQDKSEDLSKELERWEYDMQNPYKFSESDIKQFQLQSSNLVEEMQNLQKCIITYMESNKTDEEQIIK